MCIRILNRYAKRHVSRHVFSSGSFSANETICLTIVENNKTCFRFPFTFFFIASSHLSNRFFLCSLDIFPFITYSICQDYFCTNRPSLCSEAFFEEHFLDSDFILTLLCYRLQFTDMHIIPYLNRDHNYILVTDFSYTE